MKESKAISNLMEDFPPIWKQDPLNVQLYFIHDHLQTTGKTIQLEDIPEQMYGGALPVAKSRKSKMRALTEAEHLDDDAFEKSSKKANKVKKEKAFTQADPVVPSIQEEVKDLAPSEVLSKRTRSGKQAKPSPPQPAQPSIPTKKRKHVVKKLKTAPEEEDEEATELVPREVRWRKEVDAVVEKALQLAKEIKILVEVLERESTENLLQMALADEMVEATEAAQVEAGRSSWR